MSDRYGDRNRTEAGGPARGKPLARADREPPTPEVRVPVPCLYGRRHLTAVTPVLDTLTRVATAMGGEIVPVCMEDALAASRPFPGVDRFYALPFDPPEGVGPATVTQHLFGRAFPIVPWAVQDLCEDRLEFQEKLAMRGVPTPDSLWTEEAREFRAFVREHRYVVLRPATEAPGAGPIVVWREGSSLRADDGHRVTNLELAEDGPTETVGEVRYQAPPFYAQRLVGTRHRDGFVPAPVARAFLVDNEVRFWIEYHREQYRRPADWIVTPSRGAQSRFVLSVTEEARKLVVRTSEVLGTRIAAIDIVRTAERGCLVLGAEVDGRHRLIDRSFKNLPEYRDFFDLDAHLARAILRPLGEPDVRAMAGPRKDGPAPREGFGRREDRPERSPGFLPRRREEPSGRGPRPLSSDRPRSGPPGSDRRPGAPRDMERRGPGPWSSRPRDTERRGSGPQDRERRTTGPRSPGPWSSGPRGSAPRSSGPRDTDRRGGPWSSGPRGSAPRGSGARGMERRSGPWTSGPPDTERRTTGPRSAGPASSGPRDRDRRSPGPWSSGRREGPPRDAAPRGTGPRGAASRGTDRPGPSRSGPDRRSGPTSPPRRPPRS